MASERAERLADLRAGIAAAKAEGVSNAFVSVGMLDALAAELSVLAGREHALAEALRAAPMPVRESVRSGQDWHDAYEDWWYANASEAALARGGAPAEDKRETTQEGRSNEKNGD